MTLSFSQKLTNTQKQTFFMELNLLLSSGLDLKSAFELIIADSDKKIKQLGQDLLTSVIYGQSLHEAMGKSGEFSEFEINSIQIGEETNNLSIVTQSISQFYQDKQKLRKQFISALTYPFVVICIAFGVLYFMLTMVVPMFESIFTRFDKELPTITKVILNLSYWLSANQKLLWLLILIAFFFYWFLRQHSSFRIKRDYILLYLPFLGSVLLKYHLAKFAQSMEILLISKVSINRSLELSAGMLKFMPVKDAVLRLIPRIIEGQSLHESMQSEKVFSGKVQTLIGVGESVNKLNVAFAQLNFNFNSEMDHLTKQLNTLLEPFLITFVAILVGLILVAMYMPLFSLSTTI